MSRIDPLKARIFACPTERVLDETANAIQREDFAKRSDPLSSYYTTDELDDIHAALSRRRRELRHD